MEERAGGGSTGTRREEGVARGGRGRKAWARRRCRGVRCFVGRIRRGKGVLGGRRAWKEGRSSSVVAEVEGIG